MASNSDVICTSEGIVYNIWIVLAGAAAAAASYNITDPASSPNFFLSVAAFVLACVTMRPRTSASTAVSTVACLSLILGAFTINTPSTDLPLAAPAFVVVWLCLLCFSSTHWKTPWKLVPGRELSELLSFTGDVLPVLILTTLSVVAFVLLVVGCVILYAGDHTELLLEPALLAAAFGVCWVWSDTILLLPTLAATSFWFPSVLPVQESSSRNLCRELATSKFDSCVLSFSFLFVGALLLLAAIVSFICWLSPSAVKSAGAIKAKFEGSVAKIAGLVLLVLFAVGALVAAINFITSFFSDIESTFVVPGTGVWTSGPFARWLALAFGLTHVAALVSVAIPECYVMSAMMFIGLMTNLETIIDADKTNVPFVISSVIAFVANALAVLFYLFTRYNQVGLAGLTGGTTAAKVGFYLSFGLRILLVLCMLIGSMLELSEVPEQAYVYKSASFLTIAFVGFLAVFEPVSGMVAALLILPGRSLALSRLPAGVAKNAYVGDTMVVVGLGGIALVALLSIPVLLNSSVFTAPWADEGDDAGDADPHHKGDGNSSHKALLGAAPTEGPDGSQSYGSADKSPA